MCIISDEVLDVSNTNIFATFVGKNLQFTAYSNKVILEDKNESPLDAYLQSTMLSPPIINKDKQLPVAMILPIPTYSKTVDESTLRMIDMSKHTHFFKSLNRMFIKPSLLLGSRGGITLNKATKQSLTVHKCGPYSYSIVPDLASFSRLSNKTFRINKKVVHLLDLNYKQNFAFLVCILDQSAEYAPIAYINYNPTNTLFLPCRHGGHGQNVVEKTDDFVDDWDHDIYTIKSNDNTLTINNKMLIVPTDQPKRDVLLKFPLNCKLDWKKTVKRQIRGRFLNGDILI